MKAATRPINAPALLLAILAALALLLSLAAVLPAGLHVATGIRTDGERNRILHRAVLEAGRRTPESIPILLEIPTHRARTVHALAWGIDRLHAPPFAPSFRRILPLHSAQGNAAATPAPGCSRFRHEDAPPAGRPLRSSACPARSSCATASPTFCTSWEATAIRPPTTATSGPTS